MDKSTSTEQATIEAHITKDLEKIWSCRTFAARNREHFGAMPNEAGHPLTLRLPELTRAELRGLLKAHRLAPVLCQASRFWLLGSGEWVCEHMVDLPTAAKES